MRVPSPESWYQSSASTSGALRRAAKSQRHSVGRGGSAPSGSPAPMTPVIGWVSQSRPPLAGAQVGVQAGRDRHDHGALGRARPGRHGPRPGRRRRPAVALAASGGATRPSGRPPGRTATGVSARERDQVRPHADGEGQVEVVRVVDRVEGARRQEGEVLAVRGERRRGVDEPFRGGIVRPCRTPRSASWIERSSRAVRLRPGQPRGVRREGEPGRVAEVAAVELADAAVGEADDAAPGRRGWRPRRARRRARRRVRAPGRAGRRRCDGCRRRR